MESSGLEKVFETVNGKNTVTHMFCGKPISRSFRCYFLALLMKLIKYIFPEATGSINEKVTEETTNQNFSNAYPFLSREPFLQGELDEF